MKKQRQKRKWIQQKAPPALVVTQGAGGASYFIHSVIPYFGAF